MATLRLAGLGVHGVFTVLVLDRRRELAVRKAVGAESIDLVRLVFGRVLKVAAVGAVVGVVISLWSMRMLDTLLHGVAANEPTTLIVVCVGVVVLGVTAAARPALRATRAGPVTALRSD